MKFILFLTLFLFIPKLCISQITDNDDAVYLDSLYNMASEKNHKYIRVIKDFHTPNKEPYQVIDYYKSGNTAMTGATSTRIGITKTGAFTYYYENGQKKSIVNYKNDKPYGDYQEFYENGNKKLEAERTDDNKTLFPYIKIKSYWDENNVQTIKDGNGFYEGFYDAGYKELGKGKIKNNLKDSIWVGENQEYKFSYTENYNKGKLISGVSIDSNKVEHIYKDIEIYPRPKKGMNDFTWHISKTIKTPKGQVLQGKIYTTFTVATDGRITDIKVLRDLGYGTGDEAIKALKSYEDSWIPGEQRGIIVNWKFSLPINIEYSR